MTQETPPLPPLPLQATPALGPQRGRGNTRMGLLAHLGSPGEVFSNLGPNWFASVMGTGIVANAAATLPVHAAWLTYGATGVWCLAAGLLVALSAAWAIHWARHPQRARGYASDPFMAQFYGAPPMALLTVGAGTVLVGHHLIGMGLAVRIDWVLWAIGTATGLVSAVAVPYLMFTRHAIGADAASASWLMPLVPPMVSAATGAILLPYTPTGEARLDMLVACYAMFGMSLFASVLTLAMVWSRLVFHKACVTPQMVPTLWIGLGPLGQSITAANTLGAGAHLALGAPYATALAATGIVFAVPTWGFAVLWGALAVAITIRALRAGMPFALTWWSFTFPVGTCVTGTSALALHTGSSALRIAAVALYAFLVAAWLGVSTRTAAGSFRGELFAPAVKAQAMG